MGYDSRSRSLKNSTISVMQSETTVNITKFKINPVKAVNNGNGFPVSVLNRNKPAFYCIPAETYEQLMNKLEDLELLSIANERESEPRIQINMDDL